jgi:hypothetical protein
VHLARLLRGHSEAGEVAVDREVRSEADLGAASVVTATEVLVATTIPATAMDKRQSHRRDRTTMDSRLPVEGDPLLTVLLPVKVVHSEVEVGDSQAGRAQLVKVDEVGDRTGVEVAPPVVVSFRLATRR